MGDVAQMFTVNNVNNVNNVNTDSTFSTFWPLYPRRIAKSVAEKSWGKLTPDEQALAIASIPRHINAWRNEGRTMALVPYPATWLNQRRWEDELEAELPEVIFCKWPGCKSVGLKLYGKIPCCDRHHDSYVRGLTP